MLCDEANRASGGMIGSRFCNLPPMGFPESKIDLTPNAESNYMKSIPIILTLLMLLSVCTFGANSDVLMIELKANKQMMADMRLKIEGDLATVTSAGKIERFNLKQMSWLDERTNRWISLAQCKEWAEQSKASTLKNTNSIPAEVRSFLLWSLDPTFKVQKSKETLRLISGRVDYVISGAASTMNVDQYYRYAVLNAYKKAMIEKQLPPFAELKAIDQMKTLGCIPRRISITIPGVPGSPVFDMEIVARRSKVSKGAPAKPPVKGSGASGSGRGG